MGVFQTNWDTFDGVQDSVMEASRAPTQDPTSI